MSDEGRRSLYRDDVPITLTAVDHPRRRMRAPARMLHVVLASLLIASRVMEGFLGRRRADLALNLAGSLLLIKTQHFDRLLIALVTYILW